MTFTVPDEMSYAMYILRKNICRITSCSKIEACKSIENLKVIANGDPDLVWSILINSFRISKQLALNTIIQLRMDDNGDVQTFKFKGFKIAIMGKFGSTQYTFLIHKEGNPYPVLLFDYTQKQKGLTPKIYKCHQLGNFINKEQIFNV